MIPMHEERDGKRFFLDSISSLLEEIESWSHNIGLDFRKKETLLNEEYTGEYTAPSMELLRSGSVIATVVPVGAYVIGALGRFDLVGRISRQPVVLLEKGGPSYSFRVSGEEERRRPFFKGVEKDGWYWFRDRFPKDAILLDESGFKELVSEVSDYES